MPRGPHIALAAVSLALAAACADTGPVLRSARAQQHAAVVLAYLDTLHNRGEPALAAQRYLGAAFVDHAPQLAAEGAVEVLRSVSQGDLVAVQLRQAPGAAGPRPALLELFRVHQGRIVDRWAAEGPDVAPENPVASQPRPIR